MKRDSFFVPSLLLCIAAIGVTPAASANDAESHPPFNEGVDVASDWTGRRDALTERGIEVGLATYNDLVAVVDGGLERETFYPGLVEPMLGLDLETLVGWDDTHAFFRGLGMYGADPAEATGSLNAPSNLANAVQTFRIFEAWLERRFADDRLSVLAGLYAVDSEFDVKETAGVLVNGGFGTGVDLSQSGHNGPCVYPASCLGARVKYLPTPDTYLQVALLNGAAGDPDDPYGTDIVVDIDEYGVFTIGEVGYRQGGDDRRWFHTAIGLWYHSSAFDDVKDTDASGDPRQRHATPGLYALVEGELFREPDRPAEGLSGFVRVGVADPDVHQVGSYVSAGLARTGLLGARDEDVTAVGVSVPFNGEKFKAARRQAGSPVDDAEVALELTHRAQLLPWLAMQVGAQYLVNPGTDPSVDDALLLNVRCQITL